MSATDRPLRVLYIQPDGSRSGSSRSLLELIGHLPQGTVEPFIVAPRGGLIEDADRRGIRTFGAAALSRWDRTAFSHYRGLRRLVALREIALLPATAIALWRARRRIGAVDLIHVNEITGLPAAAIAKLLFRRPVVLHVRSVQRARRQRRSRIADRLVAIDAVVRRSLDGVATPCEVVHNSFSAAAVPQQAAGMLQAAIGPRGMDQPIKIAMVGTLLRMKGVFDFVDAAKRCVDQGVAARFFLVGENVRPLHGLRGWLLGRLGWSEDIAAQLRERIASLGLTGQVSLLGYTPHVEAVYRQIDLLCFPSHLDATGRPVIEAAHFGVPSIAAVSDPTPDTLIDGVTGWTIPARAPAELAACIARLAMDRMQIARAGEAARELAARHYDGATNALRILAIYRDLVGRAGEPREPR